MLAAVDDDAHAKPLDWCIEGGTLIDGSGAPRRRADVGLRGDRIVAVVAPGGLAGMPAHRRLDASGRVVAPGFIDTHAHDERLLLHPPAGAHPKLSQGVTTVVTGNCGMSIAPLVAAQAPPPLSELGQDVWRFERVADYLDELDALGPATNTVVLVGHTTLRVRHMARTDRVADGAETAAMAHDLALALDAGAWGLSTGLFYPPARAADAAEVVAVGAPLRAAGGVVSMHIRDEGDQIAEALDEALTIGRGLGAPLVLSHHKLMGRANHGRSRETLARIEQAAAGQPVCLDCYPYTASATMLLPERVHQSRDVLISWSAVEPALAGRSLFEVARERGQDPQALAQALQPGGAIYFAMDEDDVARILAHPLTMIGSDGLAHDSAHPRLWGSFPRVLGHYVRERGLMSLEAAVHKMTGLPAQRFGLADRGLLVTGMAADLVVFDPVRVQDQASFAAPLRPSTGIDAVWVGGRLAHDAAGAQDLHAGRVLRRTAAASPATGACLA
jgi:N-acyl-D-amino-acid deacylase